MIIINVSNNRVISVKKYDDNTSYNNQDILISDDNILVGDYDPRVSINLIKNKKKREIDLYFDNIFCSGYDTGLGYNLATQKTDRDAFSQDAILHERAVSLGIISNTDNVGFVDIDGNPRTVTVASYRQMLVSYGLWCRQQIIQYNYKLYLLDNASSENDINNI